MLIVRAPDGRFPPGRLLPGPIKALPLSPGAAPAVTVTRDGEGALLVELAADRYLPFVHLVSPRADLRFSDNYFDLAAGERATVRVTAADGAKLSSTDIQATCWNQRALAGQPA